jgi:protein CpxP
MKKRMIMLIGIAGLITTGALYSLAQTDDTNSQSPTSDQANIQAEGEAAPRGGRNGNGLFRILRVLNLSDEQKAQVKSILKTERPVIEPLIRELVRVHRELLRVTVHGAFDEQVVRKLAMLQGELSAKLLVEKARTWSEIYAILTPDQQAEADLIRKFLQAPLPHRGEPEE